jgi:hypothetical protein
MEDNDPWQRNSRGWSYDGEPVDPPQYYLRKKGFDADQASPRAQPEAPTTKAGGGALGGAGMAAAMATANPYVIAAAAAFQVVSGLHQAESIRANAAITAKINEMNAQALEFDAYQARLQGEAEVANYQTSIDQVVGQQRAGFAEQNVDVNFGTAAEVQAETRRTGFLNALEIQKQARARALGLTRQARNARIGSAMQDSQSSMAAQSAQTGGIVSAGMTALSGYARK